MAKRSKKTLRPSEAPLAHNPFAALGSLKDSLPQGVPNDEAPATETASPAQPEGSRWGSKTVLSRETKGRAGKTVTRVSGLSTARLEELGKAMTKALGCAASYEEGDLILHGDVQERAAAWLKKAGAPKVVLGN